MATVGETSRPGYVYDQATDTWIPVGIGPHSHTPAAIGAISSSVVTTKGDLIVATGSGVVTRQGVGADGSYLVADSTQADGLNWAGPSNMAGKNAVINSNTNIWQRGTSFTVTSGSTTYYTADRWQAYRNATGSTVSRQTTSDTTNLPFIQYCARVQRDSGNTSIVAIFYAQTLETVNSIPFAGKTVTLSFYARAGANYSGTSNVLTAALFSGTGTDQNVLTGFTGSSTLIAQSATLTTAWQRFSYTATVGSTATQLGMYFASSPTGTAGANDYFEITGVQLEHGSVATPYAPNGATQQAELAACQRYYYRAGGDAPFQRYSLGICVGTGTSVQDIILPVTMRTIPSAIEYSTLALYDGVTITAVTSATINTQSKNIVTVNALVASGLTQYRPAELIANNSTSSYLGFTAEL